MYLSRMIIGIKQYALARGISTAAIRKAILQGKELPGVIGRQKTSSGHIFTINIQSLANHIGTSEKKLRKLLVVTDA